MPWFAVSEEGTTFGPFSSSIKGRHQAVKSLAGDSEYTVMVDWAHRGCPDPKGLISLAGVVARPPDSLPVDLHPTPGARFSRSQLTWMRCHFFGTIYRTSLKLDSTEVIPPESQVIPFEGRTCAD